MIDWEQATQHMAALEIQDGVVLALFPPKDRGGKDGCLHITVDASSAWDPKGVEAQLDKRPGYSLGFIPNPGGTKNAEIKYCRALFFEDDGPASKEEKIAQWEAAGLPRPSLQVWTGGKSVHHYWLLEQPCTPTDFRKGQKRLHRFVQKALPGSDIDKALCNPSRILRLAGGIHPKSGDRSVIVSAGGQKYSYETLWNLTGNDNYSTAQAVSNFYEPTPRPSPDPVEAEVPENLQPLPEWDTPEQKEFYKQQIENEKANPPKYGSFRELSRTRVAEYAAQALPYTVQRGPTGGNTYPTAVKILCALVNHFGPNDALDICARANWSQDHWDIVAQVRQIEDNSEDRGDHERVKIFHLFDSAEFNGWVRPWSIIREKKSKESEEDKAENRWQRRMNVGQWMEAEHQSSNFTLAAALSPNIAELLSTRAKAFPVHEIAMLPPFLAAMASVMGTRYKVQIKKGWTEPMVFWVGSVGQASSMKTPVAQQVLKPLLDRDNKAQKEYKAKVAEYKSQDREERGEFPQLPRKRVAGDATLEGLCNALDNESNYGMVSYHDELVTFIASMDAYRGRGGPSKDRGHWLSMWSGQEINILRKGSDPIFIPETAVSLFGCVQQDKLTELLHGEDAAAKSGDGFWARFLWCVPCNPLPYLNKDESSINVELSALVESLDRIATDIVVTLSPEAWDIFAANADEWTREMDNTYAARAAFLGKLKGYTARFAGLLHALDYADRLEGEELMNNIDKEIPGAVMQRAVVLAKYFLNQFDVLAPQVGGGEVPDWVAKIVKLAQTKKDQRVTSRDLHAKKWGKDSAERRQMLVDLVEKYGVGRLLEVKRANQVWWQLT